MLLPLPRLKFIGQNQSNVTTGGHPVNVSCCTVPVCGSRPDFCLNVQVRELARFYGQVARNVIVRSEERG